MYLYAMFGYDDEIKYTDFSEEGFREVQQCLDRFVEVNYGAALGMLYRMKPTSEDITLYKGKVLDIIRHNPPLESVPRYFQDGREDYLWYSNFYDDITKSVYQRYRTFAAPAIKITPANYAEELTKIDLPYFRELVDLVSLEKLCMLHEANQSSNKAEANTGKKMGIDSDADNGKEENVDIPQKPAADEQQEPTHSARQPKKRSYEPKLDSKQYTLIAECMEEIKLFRRRIKTSELKKLLRGKLTEPLEVTNQKIISLPLRPTKRKQIYQRYMDVGCRRQQRLPVLPYRRE